MENNLINKSEISNSENKWTNSKSIVSETDTSNSNPDSDEQNPEDLLLPIFTADLILGYGYVNQKSVIEPEARVKEPKNHAINQIFTPPPPIPKRHLRKEAKAHYSAIKRNKHYSTSNNSDSYTSNSKIIPSSSSGSEIINVQRQWALG
ncbi:11701_t:CDS:2 [Diversispora eburnea]|uniref:11701_t:CDS:1 n=1 Tax=Diversispora eburnea TaxID=1213867 RepID=A0A9N9BSX3_9GLOM|nr:11701_t:CDS:2 [Diversispora eburnea]